MARANWYDRERERPLIEAQLYHLRGYINALADGVIDQEELDAQEHRVVEVMKEVEGLLDDATHEKVTNLLRELTAYNVMRLLRELRRQREASARS